MAGISIWHWTIVIVVVLLLLAHYFPYDGPRRM
jgi:hypothetical protein